MEGRCGKAGRRGARQPLAGGGAEGGGGPGMWPMREGRGERRGKKKGFFAYIHTI